MNFGDSIARLAAARAPAESQKEATQDYVQFASQLEAAMKPAVKAEPVKTASDKTLFKMGTRDLVRLIEDALDRMNPRCESLGGAPCEDPLAAYESFASDFLKR